MVSAIRGFRAGIGIDAGLSSLITLSNGRQIEPPKFLREKEKKLMQNHHLAKSISDAGWYQLISLTKSKAECGNSVLKDLSVRTHSCPVCGLVLDRDHNAAINILNKSNSTVGTTGSNARQGFLNRGSMQRDAQAL